MNCIVQEALDSGKLKPEQRTWAEELCVRDRASLEDYLRRIPKPSHHHCACTWHDCPVLRRVVALEMSFKQHKAEDL